MVRFFTCFFFARNTLRKKRSKNTKKKHVKKPDYSPDHDFYQFATKLTVTLFFSRNSLRAFYSWLLPLMSPDSFGESVASTMGEGRRRGSLRDLRRARNRYEQEKLLNVFLYQRDVRWKKRSALQWFILRHLISKRQYVRRVRELESRTSQSSRVEKRDVSNSFDGCSDDAQCIDTD